MSSRKTEMHSTERGRCLTRPHGGTAESGPGRISGPFCELQRNSGEGPSPLPIHLHPLSALASISLKNLGRQMGIRPGSGDACGRCESILPCFRGSTLSSSAHSALLKDTGPSSGPAVLAPFRANPSQHLEHFPSVDILQALSYCLLGMP